MKITNHFKLPESIVQAVSSDERPPRDNYISVTRLIDSPLIHQLMKSHYPELTVDVSNMLWSLLGKSVHSVLEKYENPGVITERRLECEIDGWTVSGQVDVYNNGVIEDYKITSVWSFLNGVKPEWENQLNVYAFLWRLEGYEVTALKINAILRDFQQGKAHGADYPAMPFVSHDVPLWSLEEQAEYIKERVRLHKEPAKECTAAEKWSRPETWAVMKLGRKSAVRVLPTREEAENYMCFKVDLKDQDKHFVEKRPGMNVRCEGYCSVSEFCPYKERSKVIEIEPGI